MTDNTIEVNGDSNVLEVSAEKIAFLVGADVGCGLVYVQFPGLPRITLIPDQAERLAEALLWAQRGIEMSRKEGLIK